MGTSRTRRKARRPRLLRSLACGPGWPAALGLLLALLPGLVRAADAPRIPDKICQDCHADQNLARTNASGEVLSLFVDEAVLRRSIHRTNQCAECHADLTEAHPKDLVPAQLVDCSACHAASAMTFTNSVHGQARRARKLEAAWCTSCHGQHDILPVTHTNANVYGRRMLDTCGFCHQAAAAEVRRDSHGRALERGNPSAPSCVGCHFAHQVESLTRAAPLKIAMQVCGRCHDARAIQASAGETVDRLRTYLDGYHGLMLQGGELRAAHCASCHGHHAVLPAAEPDSAVHAASLGQTCGRCHPGATANFTRGRIHASPQATDPGSRASVWAARFYQGLIMALGLFLLWHNTLAWRRVTQKARLGGIVLSPGPLSGEISPATRSARAFAPPGSSMPWPLALQLLVFSSSFVLLAWSGFAFRFPNTWLWWTLGADEAIRQWLHRGAGIALLGAALGHALYARFSPAGRDWLRAVSWRRSDGQELRAALRFAGAAAPPVNTGGNLDYAAKLEYWAAVWGAGVMGLTGLLVWFKMEATFWLPRWVLEVALVIHYWEAILACLALAGWHLFHWWVRRFCARPRHPLAGAAVLPPPGSAP